MSELPPLREITTDTLNHDSRKLSMMALNALRNPVSISVGKDLFRLGIKVHQMLVSETVSLLNGAVILKRPHGSRMTVIAVGETKYHDVVSVDAFTCDAPFAGYFAGCFHGVGSGYH